MPEFLARYARRLRRMRRLTLAVLAGLWDYHHLPRDPSRAQSAEWLQRTCRRGLRAIDAELVTNGAIPKSGLVVSNHLSYLDILAFSAALPCVFISKAEVARLPVVGKFATRAGSVYVQREHKGDAARANFTVAECLAGGVPVVLFPEGTTSDGHHLSRFHASMLQPAIDAAAPVTPCAIAYALQDGNPALEVCWWGEMPVLPHVWNLLAKSAIRVRIAFGDPIPAAGERKQLGYKLHDEVEQLRQGLQEGQA